MKTPEKPSRNLEQNIRENASEGVKKLDSTSMMNMGQEAVGVHR